MKRNIVKIDEELCNGCGACISPCAESALAIVDGKARVIKEELCDGAGFCLGLCPLGAITIESREAPAFSIIAVEEHKKASERTYIIQTCSFCNHNEETSYLIPVKHKGQSMWTCTSCLPRLIHG